MKVSKLSDEELSLKIAEAHEAKLPDDVFGGTRQSPLHWWTHHGTWQPRAYSESEIALRLLKEFPPSSLIEIICFDESLRVRALCGMNYKIVVMTSNRTSAEVVAATCERALAEAWCIAKGIR